MNGVRAFLQLTMPTPPYRQAGALVSASCPSGSGAFESLQRHLTLNGHPPDDCITERLLSLWWLQPRGWYVGEELGRAAGAPVLLPRRPGAIR
jgi:hypothetical protein